MSAAEKLGALGERANGPQTYGPEPQEWEESAVSVMAALPQILAVVEAAETALDWGRFDDPDMEAWRSYERARAALAALDEALA